MTKINEFMSNLDNKPSFQRSDAMSAENRREEVSEKENLTTSDLAGAGERSTRDSDPEPRMTVESGHSSDPASGGSAGAGTAAVRAKAEEDLGPLFAPDEANKLRARWDSVQVAFVDEPRQAVEDADRLIATTMKRLAEIFSEERQKMEHQWDRGNDVSTEDLRVALRRYRSFFSRLLNV